MTRGRPRKYTTPEEAAEANRRNTAKRMRELRGMAETSFDGVPLCCQECVQAGIVYLAKHDKHCPKFGKFKGIKNKHCFRPAKRQLKSCPQHQAVEAIAE